MRTSLPLRQGYLLGEFVNQVVHLREVREDTD